MLAIGRMGCATPKLDRMRCRTISRTHRYDADARGV
jgi:hypothetical protein